MRDRRPALALVHLHVCGEIDLKLDDEQRAERFISTCVEKSGGRNYTANYTHGSSPRVWRNPREKAKLHRSTRFISTCVEKSPALQCRPFANAVHLHVCGEIDRAAERIPDLYGSSPRVWRNLYRVCSIT